MAKEDFTEYKLLSKIARLYYIDDLNQQKIAEKLNISRTKVSRSISRAKQLNIVSININSPADEFTELESTLEKVFDLKECLIVPWSENDTEIYRNMAVLVAGLFDRILADGDTLGVGWGATLKNISAYIEPLRKINIQTVPLLGGLGRSGIEVNTNAVASIIAEKYGGTSYAMHSPAVLDSRQARRIMEKDSSVAEIFKMAAGINTALIGLSDIGQQSTMIKTGNFSIEDFKYLESIGIAGDVNLIFINEEGQPVANDLDSRLLRLPADKLKNVKNIIGAAYGASKIKVLLGAMKGNLINILVTDEKTAGQLIKQA